MTKLTHFDEKGNFNMVDISYKKSSLRLAVARAQVEIGQGLTDKIINQDNKKGSAFEVAKLAGIMAAKKTSDLIPLCHPLLISKISLNIKFNQDNSKVLIECKVQSQSSTGPDMEALVGVNLAALTFYDMVKSKFPETAIVKSGLYLKKGGKSGDYFNKNFEW